MKPNSKTSDARKSWRSFSLKTLLIGVTVCAAIFAWRQYQYEYGTINDWVDVILADAKVNPLVDDSWTDWQAILTPCPRDMPDRQLIPLLMKSTKWLPTDERRTCVLKILAEQFPDRAHELFIKIASETEHDDLKRNAILLASLYRLESDVEQFRQYLDDENPNIRSAAIDAIGIIHDPSFPMPAGFDNIWQSINFNSQPRITLHPINGVLYPSIANNPIGPPTQLSWVDSEIRPIEPVVEHRILKLMTSDPDANVRAAAARAMLKWTPKDYHLRVAEWGVWINEDENLALAQSVIDEIPPFVHQAGNSISSIRKGRTNSLITVTKPIIHIEVDQPMAIDVSVRITDGRPWFGYPMPDDFAVLPDRRWGGSDLGNLLPDAPDEMKLDEMVNIRQGYPWLSPSHTKQHTSAISGVGFRWQSLIVMPEKAKWMKLEPVTEKKYQWWNRLREVPSSWVHSRGESERFLYYDGPTEYPSPIAASLNANGVEVHVPSGYRFPESLDRKLFFIEVANGTVAACEEPSKFARLHRRWTMSIDELPYHGDSVIKRLSQILVAYGLSLDEADGLVDCWRPQFFETDGKRLITVFGKSEYDKLCPITVFPTPTEFARVGIVLTEFGERD